MTTTQQSQQPLITDRGAAKAVSSHLNHLVALAQQDPALSMHCLKFQMEHATARAAFEAAAGNIPPPGLAAPNAADDITKQASQSLGSLENNSITTGGGASQLQQLGGTHLQQASALQGAHNSTGGETDTASIWSRSSRGQSPTNDHIFPGDDLPSSVSVAAGSVPSPSHHLRLALRRGMEFSLASAAVVLQRAKRAMAITSEPTSPNTTAAGSGHFPAVGSYDAAFAASSPPSCGEAPFVAMSSSSDSIRGAGGGSSSTNNNNRSTATAAAAMMTPHTDSNDYMRGGLAPARSSSVDDLTLEEMAEQAASIAHEAITVLINALLVSEDLRPELQAYALEKRLLDYIAQALTLDRRTELACFAEGFKTDHMNLLANLTFNNQGVCNAIARNSDLMDAVLQGTKIDAENPGMVEWAEFTLRNVCAASREAQEYIRSLKQQSKISSASMMQQADSSFM